jgi:hypothetical protein
VTVFKVGLAIENLGRSSIKPRVEGMRLKRQSPWAQVDVFIAVVGRDETEGEKQMLIRGSLVHYLASPLPNNENSAMTRSCLLRTVPSIHIADKRNHPLTLNAFKHLCCD